MYYEYFGLKEPPFSIAPDPRYLYMSEQHREALAHLAYGISSEGGFVLLTGEVGTGKTTICRCLLEQLPADTDVAFVLNPKVSAQELLATICDELGIRYPQNATSVKVFVDAVNAYLLDAHARARKTVLIIEEAQNLQPDVLEQVRLLTNLETNQRKLLQIVMIGQPELRDMLSTKQLRQLAQRVTARYHMGSLSGKEIEHYVNHRLAVAGSAKQVFPASTLRALRRLSGGIPRVVNVICDRALLGAYVEGKEWVDRHTLVKAAREVLGEIPRQNRPAGRFRRRFVPAALVVLALLALGGYLVFQRPLSFEVPGFRTDGSSLSAHIQTAPVAAPEQRPLVLPSDVPAESTRASAYESLFGQWGLSYRNAAEGPCPQAKAHGLKCLEGQGTLAALRGLDRPAVLRLYGEGGKDYYATLTALEEGQATVIIGTTKQVTTPEEVEKRWLGDYTLLWRSPEGYRNALRPGQRSRFIRWVDGRLALLEGVERPRRESTVFDERLARTVKKFQLDRGLQPTGILGPETVIHLLNATGTDEPTLRSEGGPG